MSKTRRVPPDRSVHIDQIEAARNNLMLIVRSSGPSDTVEAHAQNIEWAVQKLIDSLIDEAQKK